jgi:hypothetical protein
MDIQRVLADLNQERKRLQRAIEALEAIASPPAGPSRRGRSPKAQQSATGTKKRAMSPAARKRISAMMKKRWAARKAGDDNWGGPMKKRA